MISATEGCGFIRRSAPHLALIQPFLERVGLKFRSGLQMANRTMKTIHFPESGMISVMAVNGGGLHKTQIGLIGREGMTGMPIIFGSKHSPFDTQRPRWTPGRREPPELGAKKDGLSIVFTKPRASLASKLPNSSL